MKKILALSVLIGLSAPTLSPAELSDSQKAEINEHPTPEARKSAIKNMINRGDLQGSSKDIETKYNDIINSANNIDSKLNNKEKNLNDKSAFEDSKLKVFTKTDWNMIKEHPTAEARKTAIETIQKEKGVENPTVSSAELLGAFLQEEKNALKVIEEKKKKEAEEKLAKEKEKSNNSKQVDKKEVKDLVKNGWKK